MSAIRSMKTTHRTMLMLRCKLVMLGDATVGKTAIAQMLESNGRNYPKNYSMTAGVDFTTKVIPIPQTNVSVEFFLFDCGGQSIFNQRDMGTSHYENASMVVVVYDVNNRESFKSCIKWAQDVSNTKKDHKITGVLLANKIDLREKNSNSNNNPNSSSKSKSNNQYAVSRKEGEELASTLGLQYFECAACNGGEALEAPFRFLAEQFHQSYEKTVRSIDVM